MATIVALDPNYALSPDEIIDLLAERKASYSDRDLAVIIRTSLASFGALLISQARFPTSFHAAHQAPGQ